MKFYSFFILISYFFIFSSLFVEAQCRKVDFSHLSMLTDAEYCFDCNRNQNKNRLVLNVPARDCFKNSISKSIKRHTYCFGQPRRLQNSQTPICSTNNYINTTMQVFHDVTQCTDIKRPEYFFALINRESRFQISARSRTGASCYGQLTAVALADINGADGKFTTQDIQKISQNLKSSKKREACGRIMKNWSSVPTVTTASYFKKTARGKCTLYSNPYSCLLYSALYYKKGVQHLKKVSDELNSYLVTKKDGQKMLFLNLPDLVDYIKSRKLLTNDIKTISETNFIENEDEVAHLIALKYYNGGPKVASLYKSYITKIKSEIWGKKASRSKTRLVNYLLVENPPVGISTADFLQSFSKYTKSNYGSNHAGQVASFGKNVLTDFDSVSKNIQPSCGGLPANALMYPKPARPVPIKI